MAGTYLMLYKFNNQQNADLFWTKANNQSLQPTEVNVPSGWIGPSGPSTGIGQPSSQSSDTFSWVVIYAPTSTNPFQGQGWNPDLIFNNATRAPVYVSPNIDPNSITITEGDNTIFFKGLPTPDWTPPSNKQDTPIEFQPIYYPGQDSNDFWKQVYQQVSDQIEQHDLPPGALPDSPVNPYDLTNPKSPFSPYNPDNPEIYLGPKPPSNTNDPIDVMPPGKFDSNMPQPEQPTPFDSPIIPKLDPPVVSASLGLGSGASATLAQNLIATGNVAFIAFQAAFSTGNYKQTLWGSGSSGTNISTLQNGQFFSSTMVTAFDLTWTLTPFTVGTLVGLSGGTSTYSGNWGTGSGYSFNSVSYLSQDPNDAFFQSTWSQGSVYADKVGSIAPPVGYFTGGLNSTLSSGGSTNVTGGSFTDGATLYSKCDGGTANTVFTGVQQFINLVWNWGSSYVTYNGVNFYPVATSQTQGGKIYNCLFKITGSGSVNV